MSERRAFPGDAIWERLARECGPLSDVGHFDDVALATAIRERRVLRLFNWGDGYAGWNIEITLIDDPAVHLAGLRQRRLDHLRWAQTVVFARPLAIDAKELRMLNDVSWERLSEMPHLPRSEQGTHDTSGAT